MFEDDVAVEYVPGRNASPSPYHFELEIDPVVWADLERPRHGSGDLPLAHLVAAAPLADGRAEHRALGGQPYLIYTVRTGELAAWRITVTGSSPCP